MERKLIVDCITFDISKDVINEAMSKGGPFIVKGILQRAGAKNQNGNIFNKIISKIKKYAVKIDAKKRYIP